VRELAFDFLRAILCLPFLAGHWDVRNTVADKVHIAFNWLGRFSKASVKQGNGRGNSGGLGFALDGDFNERIDSGLFCIAANSGSTFAASASASGWKRGGRMVRPVFGSYPSRAMSIQFLEPCLT
jgi:hypothetical protein